jgi:beta-N-acetylhexosaminidase
LALLPLLWPYLSEAQAPDVDATIAKLTLRQKVGQMHMIGYKGQEPNPEMKSLVDDWGLGGFFFQFSDNFADPKNCAKLVNELQKAALGSPAGIPLFFAMDQEGGVGVEIRYEQGAVCTPGNMALGASGREEDAYAAYSALGSDIRACGITITFAPAIDVLKNPNNPDYTVRLFSSDIGINATMARGAVRGLQDAGVIACAKHWPGLVYYGADTHFCSPHITQPESVLRDGNLAHFRDAIDAGTDMIMTHMVYADAWDPKNVVTLSPTLVSGILRKELGYDRLIVTDSMSMPSITSLMDIGEASVQAVAAGCDIVLQVSRNVNDLTKRMEAIMAAIDSGRIPATRLDESVRRILKAKQKYGLFKDPYADLTRFDDRFGQAKLVEANKRAALNGVVVVRDEARLLPLKTQDKKVLVVSTPSTVFRAGKPQGWDIPLGETLGHFVQQRLPGATVMEVDTVPTFEQQDAITAKAKESDVIIAYSFLARFSSMQFGLINRLLALGKPTVVVGLGDPSDMEFFPEVRTFVSANSPAPVSVEAAVKVIFGEAKPGGKLPVPIGNLYPVGYAR